MTPRIISKLFHRASLYCIWRWRGVYLTWPLALLATSLAQAADEIPGAQWCDRDIAYISFEGNKRTREHVMFRELVQQPVTPCSLDDVIDGIQNIMDLGLFKSVRAELRLKGTEPDAALGLYYIVQEKIFFLPIPRFSRTSDGELRLGAQLRWDNFLGLLHRLKVTSEKRQENDGRGRTGYVHKFDYDVPRFFGSRYGMSFNAGTERRNAELAQDGVVYGEALLKSRQLEWRLVRWANESEGIRGLSYFGGVGIEQRDFEIRTGSTGPYRDGQDISLVAGIEHRRVHNDHYRRRGHRISASLRVADKFLTADFRYVRLDVQALFFLPLKRPQTNLNVRARLGLSNLAPYGQRSYEIGGGDILRGMKTGTSTGNILTVLNIEYLSGFFAYPAWRWVVFTDIGNVFMDDDISLYKQKIRAGAGLRWKLESLTNTDLRLDLAWDPEESKVTPYLSTSLTF